MFVFLICSLIFKSGYHSIRMLFNLGSENFGPPFLKTNKEVVLKFLENLKVLAVNMRPLFIDTRPFRCGVAKIFTDAALNSKEARIGGMVFTGSNGKSGVRLGFSIKIDKPKVNNIMYLEVLAAFVAIKLFHPYIAGRRILFGIDNTSGEFSLIAGYNRKCMVTSSLVTLILKELESLNCITYWEYVASEENPADELTRLLFDLAFEKYKLTEIKGALVPEH